MSRFTAAVLVVGVTLSMTAACDRGRDAQSPAYGAQGGQYTGQPPQGTPGQYGSNPGYGQPASYGTPAAYGGQQTAPPAGQPSNFALPCQSDITCGTHKCNLTVGRCAWPCAASSDCASGFGCVGAGGPTAMCIPGAP